MMCGWLKRQPGFRSRVRTLVFFLAVDLSKRLRERLGWRYPDMSPPVVESLGNAIADELIMLPSSGKTASWKQLHGDLLGSELEKALEDQEIASKAALALRLWGVSLPAPECKRYLSRADQIDPNGHVPNSKEIVRILKEYKL